MSTNNRNSLPRKKGGREGKKGRGLIRPFPNQLSLPEGSFECRGGKEGRKRISKGEKKKREAMIIIRCWTRRGGGEEKKKKKKGGRQKFVGRCPKSSLLPSKLEEKGEKKKKVLEGEGGGATPCSKLQRGEKGGGRGKRKVFTHTYEYCRSTRRKKGEKSFGGGGGKRKDRPIPREMTEGKGFLEKTKSEKKL